MPPLRRRNDTCLLRGIAVAILAISLLTFFHQAVQLRDWYVTDGGAALEWSKRAFVKDTAERRDTVKDTVKDSIQHVTSDLPVIKNDGSIIPVGKENTQRDTVKDTNQETVKDTNQETVKDSIQHVTSDLPVIKNDGSIIPVDLSVNFLRLIDRAPGDDRTVTNMHDQHRTQEDFLPIVTPHHIQFRWRHDIAREGASMDSLDVTAYRLVVVRTTSEDDLEEETVWDSGRVSIDPSKNEQQQMNHVSWGGDTLPTIGWILRWSVTLWDGLGREVTSQWTKFGVGPEEDWEGTWMVHPFDMDTFDKSTDVYKKMTARRGACDLWEMRRPLPLFRTKLSIDKKESMKEGGGIASALLLVSGLGSFRASVNGVPLSTSGPIDPPFTDYSKRVMYRGFDVTPFTRDASEIVIGMTMGSGWWDHRPISGMAKPQLLPRGPATVVAQLVITYKDGQVAVVGATGENQGWQTARGHIRESDLFTGEMVDLHVLATMEGWDTVDGWTDTTTLYSTLNLTEDPYIGINKWVDTVPYRTNMTLEERVQKISIKAKAMDARAGKRFPVGDNFADPIGKLVPPEIPPVMPIERIAPDEVHHLGDGRWLFDFGKAFSGMLHFDEGVPEPIVPESYPRAHGFQKASDNGDGFITVIYGESLEMTTGDINRVLVAGLGLHDGGPRHVSKKEGATKNTYCFPDDHDDILSQRDVYVVPKNADKSAYAKARQSHFTTHSFRFAEVCCTKDPPKGVHALLYRTAVPEWGNFDSSNVVVNGGYELVKNAMVSNMLSVQSDCPHREKLPYGGDLVADSPAALAFFDMSSFYKKTIYDWLEAQWRNGAYTETSVWQDLNDYAGIGHGAGETVWASAPLVLSVRHYQNYGDEDLIRKSLPHHIRWLDFLDKYFDEGMKEKKYDDELETYHAPLSGLGDWLAMRGRDTFLTHTGFYMASGRCVAYMAHVLGEKNTEDRGMALANTIRDRISYLYLKNGKDNFDYPHGDNSNTPGPEMSLFSKIVPGKKRCIVLKNWFKREGHTWPGTEEFMFIDAMSEDDKQEMIDSGELTKRGSKWAMGWSQWQGFNEGIFAIRYALKTLSEMGFHNIALRKAAGTGMATPEYMMSHNATTMWESFWRSEDLYSRNHPMLGALAEWMSASAAGISLFPTTTGGRKMLFWPQFPKSASTMKYASAEQGSMRGDFAIAWQFEDLPDDESQYDSAIVNIRVRLLVPPTGEGSLRFPFPQSSTASATFRHAKILPDLSRARVDAKRECEERRKKRLGFHYNWDYNRETEKWFKRLNGKAIGTPCTSFLFHPSLDKTEWSQTISVTAKMTEKTTEPLAPGFYELVIKGWPLEKEVEGTGRLGNIPEYFKAEGDISPYCNDENDYDWQIGDATHII